MFVILLFVAPKIAPAGSERFGGKYDEFSNSFHLDIVPLIRRLERINEKICRNEVSILFNQTCLKEKMLISYTHTHIYIVSLLDWVIKVKPTCILLFSVIQSPKRHLNWYIMLVFCEAPIKSEEFEAATDLFPFVNQCTCQEIRSLIDQSWRSALIPSSSQELFFLVLFFCVSTVKEPWASSTNRSLSHDCYWFHLKPIAEENAATSFAHASYKPRTNILTSDTKGIIFLSQSFTPATIINLSLLCCLKEVSWVICVAK